MVPLFSKADLNKFKHNFQNEEALICAKFGKDLFNISKVIGRKKVAQFFLTHSVYLGQLADLAHCIAGRSIANMSWIFLEIPPGNLLDFCSGKFVDTLLV